MLAVVGLHGGFEIRELIVNRLAHGHVDFGRGSPEHYHAGAIVSGLELADVLAQSFDHLPTGGHCSPPFGGGGGGFHIITIQALGVVLIEGGRHGHNLLELIAHGLDILLLEHLGIHGCLIGVLRIHIPTAKHDIIELSQGHDVGIVQITGIGTTTNAYLIVLSH